MPARMWRHGIHAFLEVLRHRLPDSIEHMLAFIYIAYSMVALLYETVPAFEDTWIECLGKYSNKRNIDRLTPSHKGDLGRYRMAIEDYEPKDREVWSNVAKFWYNKASDKSPRIGRLYHHLAILARPFTLEQLSLYARSLTCVVPFESARGSVMTLFNPVLSSESGQPRSFSFETVFIRIHAFLFTMKMTDRQERLQAAFLELQHDQIVEKYIVKTGLRFKHIAIHIAASNVAALFEYGAANDGLSKSRLRISFEWALAAGQDAGQHKENNDADSSHPPTAVGPPDINMQDNDSNAPPWIAHASRLTQRTLDGCLKDPKNSNVYPLVHVYLVFLWSLILAQQAWRDFEQETVFKTIERHIPWVALCLLLNHIAADSQGTSAKVRRPGFPKPSKERGRPLPEDFVLRGQLYAQWYFPLNWFDSAINDDDERSLDLPSMIQSRKERILWLGYRIASVRLFTLHVENSNNVLGTSMDLLRQSR